MLPPDRIYGNHVWNILQEPAVPVGNPASFFLLLAAIDSGWKIDDPVRLIALDDDESSRFYHFDLIKTPNDPECAIIVQESKKLKQFICNEQIHIVSWMGYSALYLIPLDFTFR